MIYCEYVKQIYKTKVDKLTVKHFSWTTRNFLVSAPSAGDTALLTKSSLGKENSEGHKLLKIPPPTLAMFYKNDFRISSYQKKAKHTEKVKTKNKET